MKGLLWFLTAVWFIGSWFWYVCPHKQVCPWGKKTAALEQPSVTPESSTAKTYGPLTFNWSKPDAMTTERFASMRDSLAGLLENRDRLEVTGRYYADEENTTPYDNLGLARAHAIRDLMPSDLRSRIDVKSQLVSGSSAEAQQERFNAASFRRVVVNDAVREVEGKMVINFPHASADMLSNAELAKYLDDLVDRLKQTEERVNLVGHTDSSASASRNMRLGMQRAEAIKKILVDKGVAASRISTSSKGESQPIASNETAAGMQANRRVELIVNP